MAAIRATTDNRTTNQFDNLFHPIYIELEQDANDLLMTLTSNEIEQHTVANDNDLHRMAVLVYDQPNLSHIVSLSRNTTFEQLEENLFLLNKLPNCLLSTNSTFRVAFFSFINKYQSPINAIDLQELAILTYKMSIINYHCQLWQLFLQSGTGQLRSMEQCSLETISHGYTVYVWPEQFLLFINNKNKNITDEHDLYIDIIKQNLILFNEQKIRYQMNLDEIKAAMSIDTNEIMEQIDRYVQKEALAAVCLYFEMSHLLIKYNYVDRLLQYEYLKEKPNEDQIQLATHICQLTLTKEMAEQDYYLYKIGVHYRKLPISLYLLETNVPTMFHRIQDPSTRARLSKEYQRVLDRTKADLMHVLVSASETVKLDCRKCLEASMDEIWNDQHRRSVSERLSRKCIQLIEQRQKNLCECLKLIYEKKADFLILTVPTLKQS